MFKVPAVPTREDMENVSITVFFLFSKSEFGTMI